MKQTRNKRGPERHEAKLEVKADSELMKFLIQTLPNKSRQNIKSLLAYKQILVNGIEQHQFNYALKAGDIVQITGSRDVVAMKLKGFAIVFEDQHLIVVDKHAGILSIATDGEKLKTVYHQLSLYVKQSDPLNKIFVVHRLDRETSGLMLFAKTIKAQRILQDNWTDIVKERSYVALTEGKFEEKEGVITSYLHENKNFVVYSDQNPVDGKKAITNYKVLKSNANFSLLEVRLDTGRKNQIRVHMQDVGHSIVSDKKYGSTTNPISRLGLHSRVLSFQHPITKKLLKFATPIPVKFEEVF